MSTSVTLPIRLVSTQSADCRIRCRAMGGRFRVVGGHLDRRAGRCDREPWSLRGIPRAFRFWCHRTGGFARSGGRAHAAQQAARLHRPRSAQPWTHVRDSERRPTLL